MHELFDRYMSDHALVHKKPASAEQDEMLIRLYLRPALGSKKVGDVSRADVEKWHRNLSEIPYRANRGIALLSKAMNLRRLGVGVRMVRIHAVM